jgi:hypothetical protein
MWGLLGRLLTMRFCNRFSNNGQDVVSKHAAARENASFSYLYEVEATNNAFCSFRSRTRLGLPQGGSPYCLPLCLETTGNLLLSVVDHLMVIQALTSLWIPTHSKWARLQRILLSEAPIPSAEKGASGTISFDSRKPLL